MRIRGTQPGTNVTPTRPSSVDKTKDGGPAAKKAEVVELSSLARMLTDARAPESIDAARVEALRAKLEDGTFEIDAQRIAERMLQEEQG
ncbi:MAG: flagellar biosynthesis anti-sigma factor FlgM [Sandaracinus sp.]|nr:flagellar biosynthesis anti-sigma factor FlgM [Sandaracinus sp.]MCB9632478.1 flagellar biosynthesis anti-sigma factor FlgM [Sandaracinus sp.]